MNHKRDTAFNKGTLVNYYQVLGLENHATLTEVRKAYRGLVKTTHPDVVAPELREEATEIFKKVLLAYTVLNHPGKKQDYDDQLQSVIDAVKQRVDTHQIKAKKEASKHNHASNKTKHATEHKQGHHAKHPHKHKHSQEEQKGMQKGDKSRSVQTSDIAEPFIAVPSKPMFWKKWHTLYVVESKPNTWHATWEPNAKQRQQAFQKGILFKCVNYYTGSVLQHVQVPFGVIPDTLDACVLKLAINNSILLNLQVEKVNASGGGWFGAGDALKPSRPPKMQAAFDEQVDEHDDDDRDEADSVVETNDPQTPQTSTNDVERKSSNTGSSPSVSRSTTPYQPSKPSSTVAATEEIPLSLEVWEAVLGTEKQVQLFNKTSNENEIGTVTVPAGIQANQQLRITHRNETYLFRVSIVIPVDLSEEARNCYEILQHLNTTD